MNELARSDVALLDLLDRVCDKGVVVSGDLTISVADVELLYIGLLLVIASPDDEPQLRLSLGSAR